MSNSPTSDDIQYSLRLVQDHITQWLDSRNKEKHIEDLWQFEVGKGEGGGRTRTWEASNPRLLVEKAGVNWSGIKGPKLPE